MDSSNIIFRLNVLVWERFNISYLQIFGFEAKGISYYMEFFEVPDHYFHHPSSIIHHPSSIIPDRFSSISLLYQAAAALAFLWSLGML